MKTLVEISELITFENGNVRSLAMKLVPIFEKNGFVGILNKENPTKEAWSFVKKCAGDFGINFSEEKVRKSFIEIYEKLDPYYISNPDINKLKNLTLVELQEELSATKFGVEYSSLDLDNHHYIDELVNKIRSSTKTDNNVVKSESKSQIIRDMLFEGSKPSEIAKLLGVSYQRVMNIKNEDKLKEKRKNKVSKSINN